MYNRYVPQSDGSFRRSQMQEPAPKKQLPVLPCNEPEKPQQEIPIAPPPHNAPRKSARYSPQKGKYHAHTQEPSGYGLTGFLRQFLPSDFDSSDLLVILLLLLMADDCEENQSTALLTMALYLFL